MPNDNCPLCLAIGQHLARGFEAVTPSYVGIGGDSIEDVRLHALAAICSWWIAQTLTDPELGPEAVVRCVANCLAYEHQVRGADGLTAVRLSQRT